MALGDRIRYFRKWRGLTQQELGEAVGFSRGSADVRIGQYESNAKRRRKTTGRLRGDEDRLFKRLDNWFISMMNYK